MNTVQTSHSLMGVIKIALVVSTLAAAYALPKSAWAAVGSAQVCYTGNSCVVGEFLYDDSYDPITTATCNITSRYPDGSLYLNSVAMTSAAENDGWYSYTFTTPSTLGVYRTEVKCTTIESDVLAIDKSFEVQDQTGSGPSADDVAEATWNYSTRTLTSFGTLIADIWNNVTRTITGATLSTGSLATKADIANLKKDSVDVIEKVINGPIIEYLIESGDDTSSYELEVKIEETVSMANQLLVSSQYLKSKTNLVDYKWRDYKIDKVISLLSGLTRVIGSTKDKSATTILGSASWINDKWGWKESDRVVTSAESIKSSLSKLTRSIDYNGKAPSVYRELERLLLAVDQLQELVGDLNDTSYDNSLFAKINDTKSLSITLNSAYKEISMLFTYWNPNNTKLESTIDTITDDVLSINRLPRIGSALTPAKISTSPDRNLKNKVLGLLGLISANQQHLLSSSSDAFSSTWLELGSIVFKTIITNPSDTVEQTVPVRYDLPPEIEREDIISVDDGLEIKFDSEKNNYYIGGIFTLGVSESRTLSVIADDKVFDISEDVVASLRRQAEDLALPLKGTSYFAQGVTLKSDIDVSLDKVLALKEDAITPEEKIKNFRAAKIELDAVSDKMSSLKELVTTAGSTGTLFGFVGGAQTLAVWGMIIIMVAGFVFLALYMRTIRANDLVIARGSGQVAMMKTEASDEESSGKGKKKDSPPDDAEKKPMFNLDDPKPKNRFRRQIRVGLIIVGTFGILGAAVAGVSFYKSMGDKDDVVAQEENVEVATEVLGTSDEEAKEELEGVPVSVFVPEDSSVTVHKKSSITSEVVDTLFKSQNALNVNEENGWTKIILEEDSSVSGWVDSDFIEDVLDEEKDLEDRRVEIELDDDTTSLVSEDYEVIN